MKYRNHLMILVAAFSVSFMTSADEVYKSKGEQGSVVFSDKPSPGSKAIEINDPNLVTIDLPEPVAKTPDVPAKQTTKPSTPKQQPEEVSQNPVHYYNGSDSEKQKRLLKKKLLEHRKDHAGTPQQTPHRSGPVRQGGAR